MLLSLAVDPDRLLHGCPDQGFVQLVVGFLQKEGGVLSLAGGKLPRLEKQGEHLFLGLGVRPEKGQLSHFPLSGDGFLAGELVVLHPGELLLLGESVKLLFRQQPGGAVSHAPGGEPLDSCKVFREVQVSGASGLLGLEAG